MKECEVHARFPDFEVYANNGIGMSDTHDEYVSCREVVQSCGNSRWSIQKLGESLGRESYFDF